MTVRVVGTKQLRDELSSIVDSVSELDQIIVTQRGEGKAVLLDLDRYNQLVDRLEYLEDSLDAVEGEREDAVPVDELA